ncbi:hypothetical protein LSTR_LSTR009003 [Laodelphax striatellus]|uniref:Ribosomal RNA-processing protein 42 n=1 Tax=Laodelphax striatellus TaxID=195883 RepID=A0A482WZ07_LAOST|nr:hypothetical protein LSTR_LSTR009003 [Laodelphax striatellus]
MASLMLGEGEKMLILHGVEDDMRNDGRTRRKYRPMELETNVVSHANGSARLRLANTDILVGIKTEIDCPFPETPNLGKIEFFVDCSANATPAFEGRGGEDLAMEISNSLACAYNSFPLDQLCITKGEQCWKLYADILILECGGNLYDAVSIAVKAALSSTEVPKVVGTVLDGGTVDLVLSDDPFDCQKLDVRRAPLLVTLCKIGDFCVVDPTAEEEMCSVASMVVSVLENGTVSSSFKCGAGSLHSETVKEALKIGKEVGQSLNQELEEILLEEQNLGPKRELFGFLK